MTIDRRDPQLAQARSLHSLRVGDALNVQGTGTEIMAAAPLG